MVSGVHEDPEVTAWGGVPRDAVMPGTRPCGSDEGPEGHLRLGVGPGCSGGTPGATEEGSQPRDSLTVPPVELPALKPTAGVCEEPGPFAALRCLSCSLPGLCSWTHCSGGRPRGTGQGQAGDPPLGLQTAVSALPGLGPSMLPAWKGEGVSPNVWTLS